MRPPPFLARRVRSPRPGPGPGVTTGPLGRSGATGRGEVGRPADYANSRCFPGSPALLLVPGPPPTQTDRRNPGAFGRRPFLAWGERVMPRSSVWILAGVLA